MHMKFISIKESFPILNGVPEYVPANDSLDPVSCEITKSEIVLVVRNEEYVCARLCFCQYDDETEGEYYWEIKVRDFVDTWKLEDGDMWADIIGM